MLRAYDSGRLFGEAEGPSPQQVVCLHGWGRTSADFRATTTHLAAAGIGSVALDLPGFGASPLPETPGGARAYAALVEPTLEEIAGGRQLCLVGHSFGGRVAIALAATRPDLVRCLTLTGVPLLAREGAPTRSPAMYRLVRSLARRGLVGEARLERARQRYGSPDYRAATGVLRDVLVATVAETYEVELAATHQPVTLVWGAEDRDVPVSTAERAARLLAHGSLQVIPGVGHLLPLSAPDALARAVEGCRE